MKLQELSNEYGLYKSLDLEKDERINIFCKAGGGLIYFSLLVVGYFLSNQTLFFKAENNPYLFLQLILVVVIFILYSILHELIHLLACKIMKVNSKWIRDGITYFVSLENELIDSKRFYFIAFAPVVLFTFILIPLQIIIAIYAFDWFWLVWLVIIQNFASSVGDVVAYLLTRKFKNAYLEDSNIKISIYVPKEKFNFYHNMEKEIFDKKYEKASKKKRRKNKFKNLKKAAEEKYENDLKVKYNKKHDSDLDDLNRLDM